MDDRPLISVIIASYNSRHTIHACLESLKKQLRDNSMEVVLADSSDDGTWEVIREGYPWVRLVRLDKQTYPGPARNAAVDASRGEILAFIDTDCVADPDWLDRIVANHTSGREVVGGAVMNGTPGSYTGTAEYIAEFSEYMPQFPPRFSRMIPTCNLSVRREVFEAVGRFEEVNTAEDTLFCHRITELGYKIRFDPSIRISHHNRVILNKFLANQLNLGYGSAIVRRTVPMVGTILLKHISLQIFIPFIKMLLIGRRAAVAGAGSFLNFLFHAPLIFTGCCFYTVGFARGARVHINKKA